MNKLEQARQVINVCDENIAKHFEQRMYAVSDVIAFKMQNNLPVFDGDRENEVIEKNLAKIKDEKLKPYYRELLVQMMRISKEYQQDIMDSSNCRKTGAE